MAHVNNDCESGALSRYCSIKLFFSNKQIASIAAVRQIALYLHTEFHAALKGSEQHTTRASLFTLVPISVGPRPRSRIVQPALIIAIRTYRKLSPLPKSAWEQPGSGRVNSFHSTSKSRNGQARRTRQFASSLCGSWN